MAKRGFGGLKASLRRLSGANKKRIGSDHQTMGMVAGISSAVMPPNLLSLGLAVAAVGYSVSGAFKTYQGNKMLGAADRASRIEAFRAKRAGIASGAAKRSGRAIQASNRSGGRRVASGAPAGGNGSVKGYYRVQAGKSVFVSGYQRV